MCQIILCTTIFTKIYRWYLHTGGAARNNFRYSPLSWWKLSGAGSDIVPYHSEKFGRCSISGPLFWISNQQNDNYCTPCILYTVPIEGMNRLAKLWRKEKKRVRARSLLRCSAMWMKNQVAVVWMYDRLAFRGEKARLCIVDDDSTVSTSLRSLLL